jgi:hypothetical protein
MNNTTLTQFAQKVPTEAKDLFDELYDKEKIERTTLTRGAFFEEMVHAFANPKTVEKTVDNPELLETLQTLKDENLTLKTTYDNFFENLSVLFENAIPKLSVDELLDYINEDWIIEQIRKTQQRAMAVPTEVEVERVLAENEILFSIPEPHLSLLKATAERQNTTCKDILLDMFIRYTVEQYNQWFYPFVIKGTDFLTITGYSHDILKKWLKKQMELPTEKTKEKE